MHAVTYDWSANFTRGEYDFNNSNLLPSLSSLTIFLVAATKKALCKMNMASDYELLSPSLVQSQLQ